MQALARCNTIALVKPAFFKTPQHFRRWLARHHGRAAQLLVGFYKKSSGRPSLTWPESVDEALCFGWIDGVRRNLDEHSYCIRFTPRRPSSIWSAVNIAKARALGAAGRMAAAGQKAFEARRERRSGRYSYEQRPAKLVAPYAALLRRAAAAHAFFNAQPPSYRRAAIWWVVSARREATRARRAATLIELSGARRLIPQFTRRQPPARQR